MKRTFRFFYLLALMLVMSLSANAVSIIKQGGWFEAAYAEWTWEQGATYTAFVKSSSESQWTQLDSELLRTYGSYGRVDAVGLKAGQYQLKVVSSVSGEATTPAITVVAHDRNGFAHYQWADGVGAYKNDGTLKDNARVLYLTANSAKTVKCMVMGDKDVEYTGIQAILAAYEKGKETRPLDIRIIGTVKKADLDAIGSSAEGLQVKGKSGATPMNITIEGIGNDAAVHSFGFLVRSACSVEFRNFAVLNCMDDCISLDTDNKHCWVHNMDFFYGAAGGDADQAKGDGTVDIKGKSSHITVSYNHFFDSGKCSLGGMKSETTDCWMTYHHNWFDHSDSRHPRIRTAFYHCYNNYYDGNAKYGVGVTSGGSAFVESNYFRNCKYPMLSSKQGTDAEGDGTFSGENSGVNKAYNNKIINAKKVQYWSAAAQATGEWDAVDAATRDEVINATAYTGGTSYNSTADAAARQAVPASAIDDVENVALICRGEFAGREGLGAGRMNGGDFKWTFNYANQDANYGVISELKSAIVNYKSTLVGLADGTVLNNGGATETVDAGDGKGKVQKIGDDTNAPSWGADVVDTELKPFIIGVDGNYYWLNEANDAQTKTYNTDGIITWDSTSSYGTDKVATSSSDTSFSDPYTGAVAVAKTSGYVTFYCPDLISAINLKAVRAGSAAGKILSSQDGETFTEIGSYSTSKKGEFTISHSLAEEAKYVRVTNTTTGTLFIHGVKIFTVGEAEPDDRQDSDLKAVTTTKAMNIGETYTISPNDYTTSSTGAVTFSSNKTAVATVSSTGEIKAIAAGTAVITISQAGDDTYKAGTATISVTVTDPRAESQFAVTSSAEVSIKEGETSQIAISGAAGAVTYASNKATVATVSNTGLITAVGAGKATITITDAGNDNVKGASKTVNVTVTKDMTGKSLVTFTFDGNTLSCSDTSLVDLVAANGKGGLSVAFGDQTLTAGAKMESSTQINITPSSDANVTLIFDVAGKKFSLNGTNYTTDANAQYSFDGTGGTTYVLKKVDTSVNLVGVLFDFGNGGNTGGGDEGGETGGGEGDDSKDTSAAEAINYPTSKDGVNIKGTTEEVEAGLKLLNNYTAGGGESKTYGNGILLKVDGGFKAGDVITFCGSIAVKTVAQGGTENDYNNKIGATVKLITVDPTDKTKTSDIFKFGTLANINEDVVPTDQSFTLTSDYDEIWLVRDGSTNVTITKITTSSNGEEETSATLINYQHESAATSGITLGGTTAMGSAKIHTNKDDANGIKLANSYVTSNALTGNHIKLHVEGGFKKGDVVAISGFFNNSDDTKQSGVDIFLPKDDNTVNVLWQSEKFINGRLVSTEPVVQTYTLEFDCEDLYIGRNGNTSTFIYTLTVTRPESQEDDTATGISSIISTVDGAIYDLQGRRIAQPMKGQMYIIGGKKFVQK